MTINILAIGDVVGQTGLTFLKEHLKPLQKLKGVSFTVVNGENANVVGITPAQADAILAAGADVVTLGNHTWTRWELQPYLDEKARILRPANYAPQCPGRGDATYTTPFGPMVLVDMHAEATSEKLAMGWFLDGRVSAVWGTHTHVQTSDARVLPRGTGYISDLGMTGPSESVLGIAPEQSIRKFLGDPPRRYEQAKGPGKLEGAVFTVDTETGACTAVEAIRITP